MAQTRLRSTLIVIPVAVLAVSLATGAGVLLALALGGPPLFSPLYYTSLQAAFRALQLSGTDSWHPMFAALRWLADRPGTDVYAAVVFGEGVKFQYPATALLPLLALPAHQATALLVLNLVNLVLFAATIAAMAVLALALADAAQSGELRTNRRTRLLLAAVAALGTAAFYPNLRAVALGQIQVGLTLLFVLTCLAWVRGWRGTCGVLVGLSVLIKPQMALLLLWALLRRDWRMAAWGTAVAAAGVALAVALFGTAWIAGYIRLLSYIAAHGESFFANQSVNGLLHRLLDNGANLVWSGEHYAPYHPWVRALSLAAGVLFAALGLSQAWRDGDTVTRAAGLAAAGICFTLASPVAWEHHFGVLLPGFAVMLVASLDTGAEARAGQWRVLAASYLVAGNVLSLTNWLALTWLNPLQSYLFLAALALLALLLRPLRRHA